ncbi:helix-turn-helix transcriptional regulator [Subtercola frigoramans]|uniref:Transcriptional regulator with XRE-family HTH domain n=1 Tax=Subtercola frigoramans TaxID=120298 RepID=A0ABS2L134_9MICO|nr:helix-turn-helix transcriptional regulator [Subtercola frigoramans]MBM7470785.1 transcriptional regulator with XRE-family HTH domain [Subtercola frigoramans]
MATSSGRNTTPLDHDAVAMGELIRARRKNMGLTLKDLAALSGLSHPFISLVERGRARPSMPSFVNLAKALDATPVDLYEALEAASLRSAPAGVPASILQTGGLRHAYGDDSGHVLISVPGRVRMMEIQSLGSPNESRLTHAGVDEYLYVLEGRVEVAAGAESFQLVVGDSIRLAAGTPHNWWSADGVPFRVMMTSVDLGDSIDAAESGAARSLSE